jgi:hypothetical protein
MIVLWDWVASLGSGLLCDEQARADDGLDNGEVLANGVRIDFGSELARLVRRAPEEGAAGVVIVMVDSLRSSCSKQASRRLACAD